MTNPPIPPQPSQDPHAGTVGARQPHAQPAQPYAQPGQPYAQPPQPYAAHDAAAKPGNPAGLIAVILVAVTLALQLLASIVSAALIGSPDMSYELYGAFMAVVVVLEGLVAVAAVVLGAIGLAARGRPKALAGIGLGGGTVVLFGIATSQLTNLLLTAFRG